jgi:hypothetical protein
LGPKTFLAPKLAPTSQICNFAFEPAAARVNGSSGEKIAEKTLPYTKWERQCSVVRDPSVRDVPPLSPAISPN